MKSAPEIDSSSPPSFPSEKLRILFVITRADSIGGAQIHVRDLASRLIEDGHEVLVVSGHPGIFSKMLADANIPTKVCLHLRWSIEPVSDLLAVLELAGIIKGFRPDIVALHSSKAGVIGRLACRILNTPNTFTMHGVSFTEGISRTRILVFKSIERWLSRLGGGLIAVSEFDAEMARRAGLCTERLFTVHNGIQDLPGSMASHLEGHPVHVVMTARFDAQKDQALLIRAARSVPSVVLQFIGDGPLLPAARELADELLISDRVQFLGRRDDVSDVLSRAQVFALITNYEGFPLSTLEAMRAGLPTVVSHVGGASEAIVEGQTGFSVPHADQGSLVRLLETLAEDPELRRRLGDAGRSRFEENYTFERMYQKTLDIYQRVIREKK